MSPHLDTPITNYGVALLGSGIIAKIGHIPGITRNASVQLKAIYSRTHKSVEGIVTEKALKGVDLYSEDEGQKSFKDLLSRSDIDIVVVALPIVEQPAFIKAVLAAGKHCLSEKPIAADCFTALELIEYYTKLPEPRPIWGVGENFRFKNPYLSAIPYLSKLGRISTFHIYDENYTGCDNAWYNTPWRTNPGYQGGFILDGGLHNVGGFRLLFGDENPIVKVSAFANQVAPHLPPIDTLNAAMVLKSGLNGTYSGCYSAGRHRKDVLVVCEQGTILVGTTAVTVTSRKGEVLHHQEFDVNIPENHAITMEFRAFVDSVKAGKIASPLKPEEAYLDLHVLEQMIVSASEGGIPKDIVPV